MNTWTLLELKPTNDEKAIKKAYAKKLKVCHPEDDAEAYQRLREAYSQALDLAKMGYACYYDEEDSCDLKCEVHLGESVPEPEPEPDPEPQTDENKQLFFEETDAHNQEPKPVLNYRQIFDPDEKSIEKFDSNETRVEDALLMMEELYSDYNRRICPDQWNSLLMKDAFWCLECHNQLFWRITEFLMGHPFLPMGIWKLLNDHMQWTECERDLLQHFSSSKTTLMMDRIRKGRPFYYHQQIYFKEPSDVYYGRLENIYKALGTRNLGKAEALLREGMQLYPDDPNLLLMQGEYEIYKGNDKACDFNLKSLKVICLDYWPLRFYMANLLAMNNRNEEALAEYEDLLKIEPYNVEIMIKLSEAYLKDGRIDEGYRRCLDVVALHSSNLRVTQYANKVLQYMGELYKRNPFNGCLKKDIRRLSEQAELAYPSDLFKWRFMMFCSIRLTIKSISMFVAFLILVSLIVTLKVIGLVLAWHIGKRIVKWVGRPAPSFKC